MENQNEIQEVKKLISWYKPEVRILTISEDTALVNNGSTPNLVDQE